MEFELKGDPFGITRAALPLEFELVDVAARVQPGQAELGGLNGRETQSNFMRLGPAILREIPEHDLGLRVVFCG